MSTASNSALDIASLFGVAGKTVLVTGGAGGIGLMFSEAFVANGAKVFISSRNAKQCEQVAAELTAKGPGSCVAVPFDLSVHANAGALAAKLSSLGVCGLDVLINNSGVSWGEDIDKFSEKGWDRVMNLNVKSIFFIVQALLPLLSAAGSEGAPSRIINISSIAGMRHQMTPTYSYDVSKAAVIALTQKLACDLADRHITCNAICPGLVPSKMSNQLLTYASADALRSMIPLARAGSPQDMAAAALWLAGRGGAWVTGACVPVDGGQLVNVRPAAAL